MGRYILTLRSCILLVMTASLAPLNAGGPEYGQNWNPPPHKFLLAVCQFGQLTNQILCMRSYLKVARVINRALLIPGWGVSVNWRRAGIAYEFQWDVPVDWHRMAKCLAPHYGTSTVMTTADYVRKFQRPANVTFFQGLIAFRRWAYPEGLAMQELKQLNEGTLILPPRSFVPKNPILAKFVAANPRGDRGYPHPDDVIKAVGGLQDDVISFGEMYTFEMEPQPEPLRVLEETCANLWRPHQSIVQFVEGAVHRLLGGEYAALHLRRGDFYRYRLQSGQIRGQDLAEHEGFLPIVVLAAEIKGRLQKLNKTRLYVASNARRLEIELFKAVAQEPSENFRVDTVLTLEDLLKDQDWLPNQKWAKGALQLERRPGTNGLVFSLIDKFICAKADEFWGSSGSSFTLEIERRLRPDEMRFRTEPPS